MSLFQKNISALLRTQPHLSEMLEDIHAAEIKPSKAVDRNRIQNRLLQMKQNQVRQIVVVGLGSGHLLHEIQTIIDPRHIVVIEPDIHHLAAMFEKRDFSGAILDSSLKFALGNRIEHMQAGLATIKTSLAAHGYHVLVNPEVYEETQPEVVQAIEWIKTIVELETLHLRMRLARADLCQLNILRNLPAILRSSLLDDVKNVCKDIPALIIAAGPSLDESIQDIQSTKDRFLIIAVDTAIRTLFHHNIKPHIVVTTDPTRQNVRHFDGVQLPKETILAFLQDCHHEIIQNHDDYPNKIALLDESTHLTFWLRDILNFQTVFCRPLNVSEAAARLALHLGCNPVLFSGLDLAIPFTQGTTHTAQASHSYRIRETKPNHILIEKSDGSEEWLPVVPVPGWDEETVYTYPSFKMYIEELEKIVNENAVDWIDCTINGAKKSGCKRMNLQEAAAKYGSSQNDILQAVTTLHQSKQVDFTACSAVIQEAFEWISNYNQQFEEALSGNHSVSECMEIWNRFLQDKTVRALLDHAVFRLTLMEPLNRMDENTKQVMVKQSLHEALKILKLYTPVLDTLKKQLGPNA